MLAVDIGTSALRVSAVSLSGEIIATARARSRQIIEGQRAVLDGNALWSDVCGLIAKVSEKAGQPVGLGVAAQLGTVLVDDALAPVGPAFLWPDRRASAQARELRRVLDGRDVAIAGRTATPELTAPRLMWLAQHEPEVWARTRWVLSLKDFVVAKLTGGVATDPTSASYTLLFDVRERRWSNELAAAAAVSVERLPPVRAAHERSGLVDKRVAAMTGLRRGVPVATGGPDGSVAALGSGAVSAGQTVDVAGTTDVLLRTSDRAVVDDQRRSVLNAYLLPDLWTVGGPTGLTGGAIAWLCGVLGYRSVEHAYRAIGAAAAAIAPGADGVTFRTALSGERFPTWADDVTGSIHGLRPEHTAAHILRSAEEGGAFAVREGLEAIAALGLEVTAVRISGGVTNRKGVMQLRANVWGRPLLAASAGQASSVGAAILAAVAAGAQADPPQAAAAMVRLAPPIEPEPAVAGAYEEAYRLWQRAVR